MNSAPSSSSRSRSSGASDLADLADLPVTSAIADTAAVTDSATSDLHNPSALAAADTLSDALPDCLIEMILYAAHKFTNRGRLEDLVGDIYNIMREKFFNNEEVNFFTAENLRYSARIISSTWEGEGDLQRVEGGRTVVQAKPEEFLYSLELLGTLSDGIPPIREGVRSSQLSRPKTAASARKIRLFLKTVCSIGVPGDRYKVNDSYLDQIEYAVWSDFIAGPEPLCPQTPTQQRGPRRKADEEESIRQLKTPKPLKTRDEVGSLTSSGPMQRFVASPTPPPEKRPRKPANKKKATEEKETAKAKEPENKKRKAKEEDAEEKEKNDYIEDLICPDLKPLPKLSRLELPEWMTDELFADCVQLTQFFASFKNILPIKEIRGNHEIIPFSEIVIAIMCNDPQNSSLADLVRILLLLRTSITDEEDGDEAEFPNRDDIVYMSTHGDEIRKRGELHWTIRKTHGKPVRHLPVDWMTMSEVIRMVLTTSGHHSGITSHRHTRYHCRGSDDPAFAFCLSRPDIVTKLESVNIYDLSPEERMEIMKALVNQLLSYAKFRAEVDRRKETDNEVDKMVTRLQSWDISQDGEANTVILLRNSERSDGKTTTPKVGNSARGKEFKKVLEAHINERRELPNAELKKFLLTGVPYSELTIEQAKFTRRLQKNELDKYASEAIAKMMSTDEVRLGADRGYRYFTAIRNVPIVLVETRHPSEMYIKCSEPTVVADPTQLRPTEEVFQCSGSHDSCTVHGPKRPAQPRWLYIETRDQLDLLRSSLHPKGERESVLLKNLRDHQHTIHEILERQERGKESGEWRKSLLLDENDPSETYNIDWDTEIRELILDFEEKIHEGQLGSLESTFGVKRASWRSDLKEYGDVTGLLVDDVTIGNECLVDLKKLEDYSSVKKLAVAFLLVVKSINLKFVEPPFLSPTKDEHGNLKPAGLFVRWQKALVQCKSISALSLFLTTIEESIKWDKGRHQGKCKSCRKSATPQELVLCSECTSCFHFECAKLEATAEAPTDWKCPSCQAEEQRAEREAIHKAELEKAATTRTASGRSVKKVRYAEVHEGEPAEKRRKFTESTSSTSSSSSSPAKPTRARNSRRPRAKKVEVVDVPEEEEEEEEDLLLYPPEPSIARNKIAADKRKMKEMESVIKETMRQKFSWPFVRPVDPKEVPDYYDVIKRPMDLRTIMNKIKQRIYNTPKEVFNDFNLILSNCETYNDSENEIFKLSLELKAYAFNRLYAIII